MFYGQIDASQIGGAKYHTPKAQAQTAGAGSSQALRLTNNSSTNKRKNTASSTMNVTN
jgi:hypothetical protein